MDNVTLNRESKLKRVTFLGMFLNVVLVLLKFLVGFLSNSQVIIADAVHSLSDFVSDAFVLVGIRISSKPADETHQYGHHRFENLFTIIVGLILVFAAVFLGHNAIVSIITKEYNNRDNLWIVFSVALFSIFSKEYMFQKTKKIGEKFNSEMIIANAWHHRSDAFSSIAAATGILGSIIGFGIADPIAAMFVGIMIVKVGLELIIKNVNTLMDASISRDTFKLIRRSIESVPEVIEYHNLKARYIGPYIYCELHILVDPNLTITEAHEISHVVKNNIIKNVKNIKDVQIHIEPFINTKK